MLSAKKESDWKFDGSSTGGLSAGVVSGEGGAYYLKDPKGADVTLHYAAVGAGWSIGFKTPGNVGASLAPGAFPNAGTIYVLDSFEGDELAREDLIGMCAIIEISAGFFFGGSGSVLLLGMSYMKAPIDTALMFGGVFPVLLDKLGVIEKVYRISASAMVILGGATTYTGAGITKFTGVVW